MEKVCLFTPSSARHVLPYFDFDMDKVREYALMRNPKLKIFPISAKTGEGVQAWCDWLREEVRGWQTKE